MNCSRCGQTASDGVRYCGQCGSLIEQTAGLSVSGWIGAGLAFVITGSLGFLVLTRFFVD